MMVKVLQSKLDEAVSKISELTDVLSNLNQAEFYPERYYDESAQRATDEINRRTAQANAAQSSYGGGGASTYKGAGRSDNVTQSQITGTNVTRTMRTRKQ